MKWNIPAEVIRELSNKDWQFRRYAANRLSEISEPTKDAVPALIKALTDEHWTVRGYAAKVLGRIGKLAKDAAPILVKALGDEDWWVRDRAAEALSRIDETAIPASVKALSDEYEMNLSEPIFLGFLPKKIVPCPEWLDVPHIKQNCSAGQYVSARPPNMMDRWDFNRAGLYNDFESAFDAIPSGEKEKYEIFVYKAYPIELDKDGIHEIDILEHLHWRPVEINPEPDLTSFYRIGYDIVEGIRCLSFGHSPLSVNGLAEDFKVNELCLIDDLHYAIEAGVKFEELGAEAPPYNLFEVYRKMKRI